MKAFAIIGSNYGDCGKGLITDYLVNREKADVVVRFNGGAQAGHTVQTPDGIRHIFHHFGSGSFAGAKTFLAKDFVVNPLMFFKELEELKEKGFSYDKDSMVMIDPRAYVTTPWDIIINQARERDPVASHKGSCGTGFGETIERNERQSCIGCFSTGFSMQDVSKFVNASTFSDLKFKLDFIRRIWVPLRLSELGIKYTAELECQVMDKNIFENFCKDLSLFNYIVKVIKPEDLTNQKIVFEGAQGLGLDLINGDIPNITRSRTGLHNIIEFCKDVNIKNLEVYYVTRAYLTRHGAGKMESELPARPYQNIKELTNITNEFQGEFRYGNLDINSIADRIKLDLRNTFNCGINISPKLAITCIDQLDELARFSVDGKLKFLNKKNAGFEIAKAVGLLCYVECHGPTREDVSLDRLVC